MADELIPMVLFVVIGFITIGFFHFNSKNRQSIMDTVQKAIDQGGELTPEVPQSTVDCGQAIEAEMLTKKLMSLVSEEERACLVGLAPVS